MAIRYNNKLKILKDEIHSVVFATIDENGLPDARLIDIMLVDSYSLYFITAKGKKFYRELMEQKFAAVSGMTEGKSSLDKKAVSVRGKIRNIGNEKREEVFARNPYMNEIYPSMESRNVRRAVLVSQMEPFQSIRPIACIAADAMKSVRRMQFRKGADFILIGVNLLDGYDVLIMQRHKCCRKK